MRRWLGSWIGDMIGSPHPFWAWLGDRVCYSYVRSDDWFIPSKLFVSVGCIFCLDDRQMRVVCKRGPFVDEQHLLSSSRPLTWFEYWAWRTRLGLAKTVGLIAA